MNNIEKTIRILKIEPQNLPYEKEIANDLEGIQGEVEGLFECIYLDDNCILVCNEEGKLNGMELNRRVGNDIIAEPIHFLQSLSVQNVVQIMVFALGIQQAIIIWFGSAIIGTRKIVKAHRIFMIPFCHTC